LFLLVLKHFLTFEVEKNRKLMLYTVYMYVHI